MRIEQLTFTRFVAAFAIIVYHFGSNVMPFTISFIKPLVSQFSASVSYFFMLSGFIMIVSYWNKGTINWADYMKNRMARIYPVYFLALFIALFTAILKLDVNLFDVLYNLLMIQTWIPGRALTGNPPGWSISVEFFFYFIFPFLLNYIYKPNVAKHYLKIILGIVFLNVATQIVYLYLFNSPYYTGFPSKSHDMLFFLPLMHLNSFLIGNLGGMYFVKYGAGLVKNYDVPLVLMVLVLLTILSFPIAGLNYFNGFLSFIMIPIILLMSLNNGKITSLLNRKPFVFLGEISFSMYLLQFPLFVYSRDIVIVNTSISFFIKFIVLIIVSSIAYLYVEKPLRVQIKNFSFSKLTSRL